jgi:hypothetical protein
MEAKMKKRILMAISLSLIVALMIAGTVSAKPLPKVAVCHYDADNVVPGTYWLINISGNALKAHMAHGDYLVVDVLCPLEPEIPVVP